MSLVKPCEFHSCMCVSARRQIHASYAYMIMRAQMHIHLHACMHLVPKWYDKYTNNAQMLEYTYMHAYLHAGRIENTSCFLRFIIAKMHQNKTIPASWM